MGSEWRVIMRRLLATTACLMLVVLSDAAVAVDAEVEAAVRALLQDETRDMDGDVRIALLPSQARFPACAAPQAFLPRGGANLAAGRLSVGIRCAGDDRQVRYLPVRLSIYDEYVEVARELRRGDVLDADSLRLRRGDLSQLPRGAVRKPDSVLGLVATRRLTEGDVLLQRHVRQVPLVERGQRVVVESRGAGFVVSREGKAMDGGGLGDSVRVRLDRREIVTATVSAKGRLRVH